MFIGIGERMMKELAALPPPTMNLSRPTTCVQCSVWTAVPFLSLSSTLHHSGSVRPSTTSRASRPCTGNAYEYMQRSPAPYLAPDPAEDKATKTSRQSQLTMASAGHGR